MHYTSKPNSDPPPPWVRHIFNKANDQYKWRTACFRTLVVPQYNPPIYTFPLIDLIFFLDYIENNNMADEPLLFSISACTGFFYIRYTTHGTNGFTSHPKDEAMVKCLA